MGLHSGGAPFYLLNCKYGRGCLSPLRSAQNRRPPDALRPALQPGNLISDIIVRKSLKGFRFSAAPSAGHSFVLASRKVSEPRTPLEGCDMLTPVVPDNSPGKDLFRVSRGIQTPLSLPLLQREPSFSVNETPKPVSSHSPVSPVHGLFRLSRACQA